MIILSRREFLKAVSRIKVISLRVVNNWNKSLFIVVNIR